MEQGSRLASKNFESKEYFMSGTERLSREAVHDEIFAMGQKARAAGHSLANLGSAEKNGILRAMASELRSRGTAILSANAKDLEAGRGNGLSNAMLAWLLAWLLVWLLG